jgi:predicted MPP superfamily phosphohydrolase
MTDRPAGATSREGVARRGIGAIRTYRGWRSLSEQVQRLLTPTDWPARLAAGLGAPTDVQVERHEVRLSEPLGDGSILRIAFGTDFHAGPTTSYEILQSAARALESEAADALLLGGDFVSLRSEYVDRLVPLLARISAPLGRYAVLGNHDHWAGARRVCAALRDAGIEVLTNRCVQLPAPFDQVSLCGLDDHTSGEPDAEAALAGAGPVKLVLMHAPSGLLDVGPEAFAVAFCGHTHGGQIALPGGRPVIVAEGALSRRFNRGRYDLPHGGTLLVSGGIGCTAVPLRVNSPPAILACTLHGVPRPTTCDGRQGRPAHRSWAATDPWAR